MINTIKNKIGKAGIIGGLAVIGGFAAAGIITFIARKDRKDIVEKIKENNKENENESEKEAEETEI